MKKNLFKDLYELFNVFVTTWDEELVRTKDEGLVLLKDLKVILLLDIFISF